MIRTITVTNPRNERLLLDLYNPYDSDLLIQSIEGLGPPAAPVNLTDYASMDGGFKNSSRMSSRNIVFTFAPLGDSDSIETIRQRCYRYFPIKKEVNIVFKTDNRECETDGTVESITPTIFTNMETIQVSVVCGDPYFYSVDEIERTTFNGVESLFEFPFSNESLTNRLINFGEIKDGFSASILYQGDIDTGVLIELQALDEVKNITINRPDFDEYFKINTDILEELTGEGFHDGDRIVISTIKLKKSVHLDRRGIRYNIMSCVERGSTWFQLVTGDNYFNYTAEKGAKYVEINMQNRVIYEGI